MHLAQENPPREFPYLHIFTNLKWENLHFGHTLARVDPFQISTEFLCLGGGGRKQRTAVHPEV